MTQIPNNDFLTLTRDNPESLAPFSLNHDSLDIEVWDTGVIYIAPKSNNFERVYIFSSAIHGNETAPIEVCDQIITDILGSKIEVTCPTLFIYGNPQSINIEKRFVKHNLNRLFCGAHGITNDSEYDKADSEFQRAFKLEEYVTRFFNKYPTSHKTHYDLHTAIRDSAHEKFAVYPFLHGKPWHKQQFETVRAMGVTTFLLMQKPATTFSYYSSKHHGAHSFTIELGKVRRFGENDASKFAASKQTVIDLLKGETYSGDKFDKSHYQLMTVYREINKQYDDFSLCFADDTANFAEFKQGDVLASENGNNIMVEKDGEAIVFPNANVEIGQRAILTVLPTDISDALV